MEITRCTNDKCVRRYECLRYMLFKVTTSLYPSKYFKCGNKSKNFLDKKDGFCYSVTQKKKLETLTKVLEWIKNDYRNKI